MDNEKEMTNEQFWKECCVYAITGFIALFIAFFWDRNTALYPETCKVANVEEYGEDYLVEFITSTGNVFEYIAEDGDIHEGELYSILFDNQHTQLVQDDKIVKIKYSGF